MLTRHFTSYKPPSFFLFLCSRTYSSKSPTATNPIVIDYLTHSLGFSSPQALSLCQRFPGLKTLEKPHTVVQFLKSLGFSDTEIRSSVYTTPQILHAHIDNILKPKIKLFQDLGLPASDVGKFFSKNSPLLARSLDKRLIPCVDILKNVLVNEKDLILVINQFNWIFNWDPEKVLKVNVEYLMECGIFGNQLSMLLRRRPRLFTMTVCNLRELVSKVVDMGVSVDSRMFVYALQTVNSMSNDTLMRKFQLFHKYGFSEADSTEMFRRMPVLFRSSQEKLKFGLSFFLNTVKLKRITIVRHPRCLMNSMENRVIPRYKVLEILKSKRLLKKQPSFITTVLGLPDDVFMDKFISRFPSNADELLAAYKERLLLETLEETELENTT